MWRQFLRRPLSGPVATEGLLRRQISASLATGGVRNASASAPSSSTAEHVQVLTLANLPQPRPHQSTRGRRIGRGIGSSKGKTSGRGHKGQKSRSGSGIPLTFEGGQTALYKVLPKRGLNNKRHATPMTPLSVQDLANSIAMGRMAKLSNSSSGAPVVLTLHDFLQAGLFGKANAIPHGVKLLAATHDVPLPPGLHLKVSRASPAAIAQIEAAGGTVESVHYNRLALRQLLSNKATGYAQARPPPKMQPYYTSWSVRGYLHPAVQLQQWLATRSSSPQLEALLEQKKQQQGAMEEEDK